MLQTKAVFNSKHTQIEAEDCIVEKIIHMSGAEFDYFSRHLTRDMDFISDNRFGSTRDAEGRRRCLLVTGEGRRDGILVESSGYDYARYTAFMPNVMDFLTVGRYPALAALTQKLTGIVDYIVEQTRVKQSDEATMIDFEDLGTMFDIDFMENGVIRVVIFGMLDERPEINCFEAPKNGLIIYGGPEAKMTYDLSDPTVTKTDMYVYGYAYDDIIPLRAARALELFDSGHDIFLLYPDGIERLADTRHEIESFDGLFGAADPAWNKSARAESVEVFILNREQYEKGEVSGEWLKLPADADTLRGAFERIGIDRPSEGAFSVAAIRVPYACMREYVTKYDSIDELNMLASHLKNTEDFELVKLQAILTSQVVDVGCGAATLINLLDPHNLDSFRLTGAEASGMHCTGESDEKSDIDQCIKEECGVFTDWGYLYSRFDEVSPEYDGIVPDEYRIVSKALRGLTPKTRERGGQNGKQSVVERIRAARQVPGIPRDSGKRNRGEPEL